MAKGTVDLKMGNVHNKLNEIIASQTRSEQTLSSIYDILALEGGNPVEPTEPTEPTDPVEPTDPTDPVDPFQPGASIRGLPADMYFHDSYTSDLPWNNYRVPKDAKVQIVHVTTRRAGVTGSLEWALKVSVPAGVWRLVVFDVAGTFEIDDSLSVNFDRTYIAAHTAPGHVRLIGNRLIWRAKYGCVMHMAFGGGYESNNDSLQFVRADFVRVENVSARFARDEVVSVDASDDVCQNICFVRCMTAFPLIDDEDHRFGGFYFLDGAINCSGYGNLAIGGRRRGMYGLENPCVVGGYNNVYVEPEDGFVSYHSYTYEGKENKSDGIDLDLVNCGSVISPSNNNDESETAEELAGTSDSRTRVGYYAEGNGLCAEWGDPFIPEEDANGRHGELRMAVSEPIVPLSKAKAFALKYAGSRPANRDMIDKTAIAEAVANRVKGRKEPFGEIPDIDGPAFEPIEGYNEVDQDGVRLIWRQLDKLHVELGGITQLYDA